MLVRCAGASFTVHAFYALGPLFLQASRAVPDTGGKGFCGYGLLPPGAAFAWRAFRWPAPALKAFSTLRGLTFAARLQFWLRQPSNAASACVALLPDRHAPSVLSDFRTRITASWLFATNTGGSLLHYWFRR